MVILNNKYSIVFPNSERMLSKYLLKYSPQIIIIIINYNFTKLNILVRNLSFKIKILPQSDESFNFYLFIFP